MGGGGNILVFFSVCWDKGWCLRSSGVDLRGKGNGERNIGRGLGRAKPNFPEN